MSRIKFTFRVQRPDPVLLDGWTTVTTVEGRTDQPGTLTVVGQLSDKDRQLLTDLAALLQRYTEKQDVRQAGPEPFRMG